MTFDAEKFKDLQYLDLLSLQQMGERQVEQPPVSREEILAQSRNDPILYRALSLWNYRKLSFEEAMTLAAFELSKQNHDLRNQLIGDFQSQVRTVSPFTGLSPE